MKRNIRNLLTLLMVCSGLIVKSQDTLTVMHYNLLNFGNFTTYCTTNNNSLPSKDIYLKTIAGYVKPDVMCVNELAADPIYADRILANSLNVDGVTSYQRAAFTNNSSSDLVNMLFYNSSKLTLYSQKQVSKDISNNDLVRVIDIYKLYYKDANLSTTHDTIFINFISAHLKAGSTSADAQERAVMTQALMAYLGNPVKRQNYIMSGDFNVYTSSEAGFQNLVNPSNPKLKFYDPINALGAWSNDGAYASVHTQSTHSSNTGNGCPAAGGLDDRFDFILMNDFVMGDSSDVKYVAGSYKAVGQDGNHFNQDVSAGANNSVPAAVLSSLYSMSDHLPVIAKLRINGTLTGVESISNNNPELILVNPVTDALEVRLKKNLTAIPVVEIYSLSGQLIYSKVMQNQGFGYTLLDNTLNIAKGTYILSVVCSDGYRANKKIVKY